MRTLLYEAFVKESKGIIFLFISWLLLVITPRVISVLWRPLLKMKTLIYDTHMRQYWEYAISTPEIPQELIQETFYLAQFLSVLQHPIYINFGIILTVILLVVLGIRCLKGQVENSPIKVEQE